MANITIDINVPQDKKQDIITSITDMLSFDDIDQVTNPTTRVEFFNQQIKEHIRSLYGRAKSRQLEPAHKQARKDAMAVAFD